MTLLDRIHSGRAIRPRRTMLYGVHGIGKSTFASMAANPVFIPTEDGLGDIDCHSFPVAKSLADVTGALSSLAAGGHNFGTVIIDSLDWLERLIWAEVCTKRRVESIEDIGYAKGYAFAMTHWNKVLSGLDALRRDGGMAVILLAHSKIEKFDNPETDSYDRYSPRLHKHASALIQEWCDEVLFATYRVMVKKTDEGFNKERGQGIGSGERIIRTTERPAHMAKSRLNLPEEMPLDYRVYAQWIAPTPGAPDATPATPQPATAN